MHPSTRHTYLGLITLLLIGMLALGGCARPNRGRAGLNPNGSQPVQQPGVESTAPPTIATSQPTLTPPPAQTSGGQAGEGPELDDIDSMLKDLQNELNQTDTVSDFQ